MNNLSVGMQKVQGLEKLNNGALDKFLLESFSTENKPHITQTHLCGLEDENRMFAMQTSHLERVQQLSNVVDSAPFV